ncbi:hypothetical protein [Kribbella steppae]|uniref:hypothetical protein n=1 Tax=Kribbella steppae TaxID=2512223 RepID=UPI00104D97E0|nr:hypothetical protein [Kribbella steppae]
MSRWASFVLLTDAGIRHLPLRAIRHFVPRTRQQLAASDSSSRAAPRAGHQTTPLVPRNQGALGTRRRTGTYRAAGSRPSQLGAALAGLADGIGEGTRGHPNGRTDARSAPWSFAFQHRGGRSARDPGSAQ